MQRVYFVIDMKSFFASVECAERKLNAMTTNLVVADETRSEKTICLAISPSMKALGIKNRCRLFEIPKNVEYIIAQPRMRKYIEYASNIYAIYLKYIDKNDIHVYSIDECIIDVTDYLTIYKIRAKEFAKKLLNEIWTKLGIPATCGIGTNMYLAKIALDISAKNSADGIAWLNEEKFLKTLSNHKPITDFWQISTGTATRLAKYHIYDMQGIREANENLLYKEFGVNAELLIDHAKGIETCLMSDIKEYKTKSKSISSSQILPCNYDFDGAKIVLKEMLQNGCYSLADEHLVTNQLVIYIGYGDGVRSTSKGMTRFNVTTNLFSQMQSYAEKLYNQIADKNKSIRKIGFCFFNLQPDDKEQYDFFTDYTKVQKEKKVVTSILELREKFGKNSVLRGIDLDSRATQKDRNTQIGGHKSGES